MPDTGPEIWEAVARARNRAVASVGLTIGSTILIPIGFFITFAATFHTPSIVSAWRALPLRIEPGGSAPALGIAGLVVGLWVAAMLGNGSRPLTADIAQMMLLRALTRIIAFLGAIYCWTVNITGGWSAATALDQLAIMLCGLLMGALSGLSSEEAFERSRWVSQARDRVNKLDLMAHDLRHPARSRPRWDRVIKAMTSNRPGLMWPVWECCIGVLGVLIFARRGTDVGQLVLLTVLYGVFPAVFTAGALHGTRMLIAERLTSPRWRFVEYAPFIAVSLLMHCFLCLVPLAVGTIPELTVVPVAQLMLAIIACISVKTSRTGRQWTLHTVRALQRSSATSIGWIQDRGQEVPSAALP